MRKFWRYAIWALAVLVLLGGLGAGGGYLWLRSLLPATEGTVAVLGLGDRARISRDADGLVYIRAETDLDAYFALGYAHAQDRMWQMEATRRLGAGRLAEIGGARFVDQDRTMRRLGVYRLAEAALAPLSAEGRAALDAYVRGVNAWIEKNGHRAGPEFLLLGIRPEPWRAADSLVWARLMALRLSGNWVRDLESLTLRATLPADKVRRLFPPDPPGSPVTVPAPARAAEARPDHRHAALSQDEAALLRDTLARLLPDMPAADTASNGWAVAGAGTVSGKPVMANDPHLGLRLPNIWYLARIDVPGLTVAGATAPGVPFHVLGHNGHIAWGMTTTGADTQDIVREAAAPGTSDRYLAPDGPSAFVVREEVIRVRGADDVRMTVRESRNGPIVATEGENALALRAAALQPDDATAEALYRINRARDWRAFTAALQNFHSPVQNLIYADTSGRIGFSVAGRIPLRGPGNDGGILDGRERRQDWRGFIPADRLPRLFDPERGVIVNANNRVVGPGYPYLIANRWEAPFRALRAEELLAAPGRHDPGKSRRMQMDAISIAARELTPLFLKMTPPVPDHAEARRLLGDWDGAAARERAGALIFNAWFAYFSHAVFDDDIAGDLDGFNPQRPVLIGRVLREDGRWCDDIRTPDKTETCPEMLSRALDAALAALRGRFGGDVGKWRWGDAHVAALRNPALDWLPVIGFLSRAPVATDGDNFTLNRGTTALRRRGLDASAPFHHVHGPVLRAVYDLADLDASAFAMPGGQSAHFLSPHYSDLTLRWRDGAYLRLPPDPPAPVRSLILLPAVHP